MHYFGHTIDNGVKFLYFVRSLLPSKSPILTKYWWVPLERHVVLQATSPLQGVFMYVYLCYPVLPV